MDDAGRARCDPNRSDADGPGHYDRHRLSGHSGHFQGSLTVRGLTTAASIWVTAAIGVLVGIGFWVPALLGSMATLAVLSGLRWIENRLASEFYAQHHLLLQTRSRVARG
jgi:MgtC family protein